MSCSGRLVTRMMKVPFGGPRASSAGCSAPVRSDSSASSMMKTFEPTRRGSVYRGIMGLVVAGTTTDHPFTQEIERNVQLFPFPEVQLSE